MRKLISNTALVAIATGGMLFASCSDHDMFNPNYKVEEYAANWENKIGAVDPNQDWSMATSVTASINVAAAGNGVLSIYTENPVHSTARLLTKVFLKNGSGSATFDAVKGTDQVFVIASNNGKNVVYGWADIINGQINAGKTVAKKAAKTRAGEDCPVTKGEIVDLIDITIPAVTHKEMQTIETPIEYTIYNNNWGVNGDWYSSIDELGKAICAYLDSKGETWHKTNPEWIGTQENGVWTSIKDSYTRGGTETKEVEVVDVPEQITDINLTMLNGVEKKAVQEPWTLAWGIELFGKGGFFQERVKFFEQSKLNLINKVGTTLDDVEKGFSIVSEGGEITLPFMYGSTGIADRFGYVYYKDGEDPLNQPHYILMDDGKPSSNIYLNNWGGTPVGDMQLSDLVGTWYEPGDPNIEVYGTEYKLTYFDEKGNATYNFPPGYNIIFFIAPYNGSYTVSNFNYSLPELNKRIQHTDNEDICKSNPHFDAERGAIKATAWKYNGNVFLGFEDGGGDEDLNDIVFWVEGKFKPNQPLPEVPSTTQPKEEFQSWILACEDLGSTDDYDFNDIVLEVRTKIETEETFEGQAKTGETFKKATLQVRCLAAGGTYQANISYDNGRVNIGESHALLGRPGSSDMLNTKTLDCPFSEWITLEETTDATEWANIQNNNSWSSDNITGKIQIVVTADDKTGHAALISAPTQGEAPQMIIVPGDWLWPTERAHIEEAYPDFKTWNSNATLTDWNANKVADKLIKR